KLANGSNATTTDEVYGYGSGGWGRVNLGAEDGSAYLLQVAAPSADSNVDGLRTNIAGVNPTVPFGTAVLATAVGTSNLLDNWDYQQADFRATDRLTYLTPKFNGFQAGVSYAPKTGLTSNTAGMSNDDAALPILVGANTGTFVEGATALYKDLWEAS